MLEKILHRYLPEEVCKKKFLRKKTDHPCHPPPRTPLLTKGKWSTPKEIKDCFLKQGTSLSLSAVINEGQGRHWNPL